MMKRNEKDNLFYVPIYNVPMMSDNEWERLSYKNWLEIKGHPVKESRKENDKMILKFTDGIEIVIDDDKLVSWEQVDNKKVIKLSMLNENGYCHFELNFHEKVFRNIK